MAQQENFSQILLPLSKIAQTFSSSVHLRPHLAHTHGPSTSIVTDTQKNSSIHQADRGIFMSLINRQPSIKKTGEILPSCSGIKLEQSTRKFKSFKQNFVKYLNWNKNNYWSVVWEKLLAHIVKIWEMKCLACIVKSWQKKKQFQPSEAAAERCSLRLCFL